MNSLSVVTLAVRFNVVRVEGVLIRHACERRLQFSEREDNQLVFFLQRSNSSEHTYAKTLVLESLVLRHLVSCVLRSKLVENLKLSLVGHLTKVSMCMSKSLFAVENVKLSLVGHLTNFRCACQVPLVLGCE